MDKKQAEMSSTEVAESSHSVNKDDYVMKAKVKFNYDAKSEDELTLKAGDIITEVESDVEEDEWYHGILNSSRGIFPKSYVEVFREKRVKPPPPQRKRQIKEIPCASNKERQSPKKKAKITMTDKKIQQTNVIGSIATHGGQIHSADENTTRSVIVKVENASKTEQKDASSSKIFSTGQGCKKKSRSTKTNKNITSSKTSSTKQSCKEKSRSRKTNKKSSHRITNIFENVAMDGGHIYSADQNSTKSLSFQDGSVSKSKETETKTIDGGISKSKDTGSKTKAGSSTALQIRTPVVVVPQTIQVEKFHESVIFSDDDVESESNSDPDNHLSVQMRDEGADFEQVEGNESDSGEGFIVSEKVESRNGSSERFDEPEGSDEHVNDSQNSEIDSSGENLDASDESPPEVSEEDGETSQTLEDVSESNEDSLDGSPEPKSDDGASEDDYDDSD